MAETSRTHTLIPTPPIPECAQEFSARIHGLLDGQPKDEATVAEALMGMDELVDHIAAALYTVASMLVGEGEESIRLVEQAIANVEVSGSGDPLEGRRSSRRALCAAALDVLRRRDPESLVPPEGLQPASSCIGEDDLDAVGVSHEDLESMIAGPDRDRVRTWLESLPTTMRTIFVLRAVAGLSTPEAVALLKAHGGSKAAAWTPEALRELFRQGLCSLASHVLQEAHS